MIPEHGTIERYRRGPDINDQPGSGCRCPACTAENTRVHAEYRSRKARERWGVEQPKRVHAEPVRQHVRALMAAGIGWERIARLAGVSRGTVGGLLYGNITSGRPPSRHITSDAARKLLALQANGAVADGRHIDATGTHRRLQSLMAVGWTGSEIMRRLGRAPRNFPNLLNRRQVEAATARAVIDLYDQLWDQPPPASNGAERWAADQARGKAAAHGWPPPVAWDDDTIDDPAAKPDLGGHADRNTVLLENSDEIVEQGHTFEQAAERLGVSVNYLHQARSRARKTAA